MSVDGDNRVPGDPEAAGARLVANVETVVRGKTEEIRLVLSALLCGGHVLLEDVPGTAKTVLARAIAGSIAGRHVRAHPVHARPPADRRHRSLGVQPARPRLRVPARARLRERRPRRRDQPRHAEDAVGAARGDGGAPGHGRRRHAARCPIRSSSWRPRTRSSRRGRSRFPRRSSTASSCAPPSGTRAATRTRSSRSSCDDASARRGFGRARRRGGARARAAVQDVYIDPLLRRWVVRLVRATRARTAWRSAPPCEAASHSSGRPGPGRSSHGRDYATPVDVEQLFLPVVQHRIVFTPSFVATAREIGWTAATERFRDQCLELAPRPGAELQAVPAAAAS